MAVDQFHKSQDRLNVDLTPVLDGQYVTKLATAIRGREGSLTHPATTGVALATRTSTPCPSPC